MSEECRVSEIEGEPFRFHVHSMTKGEVTYLCDLEENSNLGMCSCLHWQMRLGPKVRAGEKVRCKHLRASRDYAFDGLLKRLQHEMSKARSRR